MKRFVFTCLFLLCLSDILWGQGMENMIKVFQSPRWLLYQEAQERPLYRRLWNGGGNWTVARIVVDAGGDQALNLTEEQHNRLTFLYKENELGRDLMIKKMEAKDPEFLSLYEAAEMTKLPNDPDFKYATEEQRQKFIAAHEAFFNLPYRYMDEEIEATFTPEQWKTLQEAKIQLMPEMGLPMPSMFEVLGLSDEQRKQMETVKQNMNAEFETLLDELMKLKTEQRREMVNQLTQSLGEDISGLSEKDFNNKIREAAEKAGKNETIRKKIEEKTELAQKFAVTLKIRLMNVLTDEQLDKMQEIINSKPDFIVSLLDKMNKQRLEREKKKQWDISPDVWRPGDGVPEQFKKERQNRQFPN
ncbi:MAG: hypothetical protein LBU34_11700 [Planctomycetaceae bacterium]|jgi:hypothetical protein|nr:hypothetical protein [Planctomycetaceae bacterium]